MMVGDAKRDAVKKSPKAPRISLPWAAIELQNGPRHLGFVLFWLVVSIPFEWTIEIQLGLSSQFVGWKTRIA